MALRTGGTSWVDVAEQGFWLTSFGEDNKEGTRGPSRDKQTEGRGLEPILRLHKEGLQKQAVL